MHPGIQIKPVTADSKLIIGLGDSFTQGVGSWSKETYKKHKGFIDPLNIPINLEIDMYEHSWVSQMCKNHLPNYTPMNFGIMGRGNRAALKDLYFYPNLNLEKASEVIVVYMLSGIERFDFVSREFNRFHHFFAMWPNPGDKNSTHRQLWESYAKDIWSEKFVCLEAILNIKEAEMICKANGWHLVIASAFDQRITKERFLKEIGNQDTEIIDSVPWDKFLYPQGCNSFMQLLLRYDGREELADGAFYDYYSKLKEPTKYITNCMHPTREGYRIMAEEIFKFIKEKGYIKE
jgi:hypothetical protein